MTIQGNGSLIINGNANDGLTSKDDLTIISGKITVNSKDDAIRGKNSLTIDGGELHITAGGDGLKSDDEEDGNLIINSGNITISAESDGAQAYHTIEIN